MYNILAVGFSILRSFYCSSHTGDEDSYKNLNQFGFKFCEYDHSHVFWQKYKILLILKNHSVGYFKYFLFEIRLNLTETGTVI